MLFFFPLSPPPSAPSERVCTIDTLFPSIVARTCIFSPSPLPPPRLDKRQRHDPGGIYLDLVSAIIDERRGNRVVGHANVRFTRVTLPSSREFHFRVGGVHVLRISSLSLPPIPPPWTCIGTHVQFVTECGIQHGHLVKPSRRRS